MESGLSDPNPRARRRLVVGASMSLALLMAACAPEAPMDYLNHPEGEFAIKADRLWDIVFWIATAIFVVVEGLLVYALLRFRHREGRKAAQFHGNTRLEVILTLVPALILAGVAIPTVRGIFDIARARANPLQITVIGHQFWWEYRYENTGVVTANELHIPTNTNVRLAIQGAANDVIHSFWVPRLAGKQDVVPGHTTEINLRTDQANEVYLGQCTEFCGLSHANMRLSVHTHTPEDFEEWLADQRAPAVSPPSGPAAEGEELVLTGACAGCHTIEGTDAQGEVGPDLTHLASRDTFAAGMFETNAANLRRWVADAPGMKPGVLMPSGTEQLGLSPEDIDKIVAYLLTLE